MKICDLFDDVCYNALTLSQFRLRDNHYWSESEKKNMSKQNSHLLTKEKVARVDCRV